MLRDTRVHLRSQLAAAHHIFPGQGTLADSFLFAVGGGHREGLGSRSDRKRDPQVKCGGAEAVVVGAPLKDF